MTGADSLAQTVRDAVDYGVWSSRRAPALRALDELVGRLAQAESYEREEQALAARLREERDEALARPHGDRTPATTDLKFADRS